MVSLFFNDVQMFWVFTVSLSVIFVNGRNNAENVEANNKASIGTPQVLSYTNSVYRSKVNINT